MKLIETALPGVVLVEPETRHDARGWFVERWNPSTLSALGIAHGLVQDNLSHSAQGVLRGLHYQLHEAQGKLVQVWQGTIFDVVVDVRRSSPGFGRWIGQELSGDAPRMLWIPPGFAHGFLVLSETATVGYATTAVYNPQGERGIRWDDPEIGVRWPLHRTPQLSVRDVALPLLRDAEVYP